MKLSVIVRFIAWLFAQQGPRSADPLGDFALDLRRDYADEKVSSKR
jgi:hypothetical protein